MDMKKSPDKFPVLSSIFAILVLSLLAHICYAADYELEIIQPQPNLSTLNRFYKAYPGLEYNVRLGVIGGKYPYTYSLSNAPEGMTINKNTGEISWLNPTETSSSYAVTAEVVDGENVSKTVSWSVTVVTTGFKFVDSVLGDDSNTGTLAAPWATFEKVQDADVNDFIYFRAGSYSTTQQWSWSGNEYPVVFMAYPNETPVFDLGNGGLFITDASNRLFVDGLHLNSNNNIGQRGISYPGNLSNITFRRNKFYGLNNGVSGSNPSMLFSTNSSNPGNYTVIQDNEASNGTSCAFYLAYANRKVLVEDNHIHNMTNAIAITPKDGNRWHFIRGNNIHDVDGLGVFIQGYDSRGNGTGDVVVEFNRISVDGSPGESFNLNNNSYGNLTVNRNTFSGKFYVSATGGPYLFSNNVIVNEHADFRDRIRITSKTDGIEYTDNLTGGSASNIIDESGNLTSEYEMFVGLRGHQVVRGQQQIPSGMVAPRSPAGLVVEILSETGD